MSREIPEYSRFSRFVATLRKLKSRKPKRPTSEIRRILNPTKNPNTRSSSAGVWTLELLNPRPSGRFQLWRLELATGSPQSSSATKVFDGAAVTSPWSNSSRCDVDCPASWSALVSASGSSTAEITTSFNDAFVRRRRDSRFFRSAYPTTRNRLREGVLYKGILYFIIIIMLNVNKLPDGTTLLH